MAWNHCSRGRWLGAALALTVCLLVPVGTAFAQDADATVDMKGLSFAPTEIHVAPGATVLWTNSSQVGHTVTADDGVFDAGDVEAGERLTQLFDAAGVYHHCSLPPRFA